MKRNRRSRVVFHSLVFTILQCLYARENNLIERKVGNVGKRRDRFGKKKSLNDLEERYSSRTGYEMAELI